MKLRIQKHLSQEGILSRRKAEEYLLKGWIKVNGEVVTTPGTLVDPFRDKIELSPHVRAIQKQHKYLAYYKPRGIVTNLPQRGEREIKDLLPPKYKNLHAIGRLDKESEGLILLTNDGVFANSLLNAGKAHERIYHVTIDRILTPIMQEKLETGMLLFGEMTKPIKVKMITPKQYGLTMIEGKNRQIRRMMEMLGAKVLELKRVRFGKVSIDTLTPDKFRELHPDELVLLREFGKPKYKLEDE